MDNEKYKKKIAYNTAYNKNNYGQIAIRCKQSEISFLKSAAKKHGFTVNKYILECAMKYENISDIAEFENDAGEGQAG